MEFTLTKELCAAFANDWYALVDAHAPIDELLKKTDGDTFSVVFPGRMFGRSEFIEWYEKDIHTYYDGRHRIHEMHITTDGDTATLVLRITWKAKYWNPPCAYSEDIVLKPDVTMKVVRNRAGNGILLQSYSVVDREE